MIRRTKDACSAILVATLLSAAPVTAQVPQASPASQDKAAGAAKKAELGENNPNKAERHGDKSERHGDKGDDRGKKGDDPAADKGAKTDRTSDPAPPSSGVPRRDPGDMPKERLERRRNQQDLERTKIKAALHGHSMTEAMRQELQHHARRLARLERIKAVAVEAKDTATIDRVNKLIDMENARHDRFTSHFEAKDDKDDKGSNDDKGFKEERGRKDEKGPKDEKSPKDDKGGAK
jgi:hypothetical protein